MLRRLADRGAAVLMIAAEPAEVLALADRVIVMRAGRQAGELAADAVNEENLRRLLSPQ